MDISSSDSECNEPSPLRKRRKLNNDRQRLHPRSAAPSAIRAPPAGLPVDRRKLRRAGRYIIGPEVVGVVPVKCLVQYIAKREKTNQFYLLKVSANFNSTNPGLYFLCIPDRSYKNPQIPMLVTNVFKMNYEVKHCCIQSIRYSPY